MPPTPQRPHPAPGRRATTPRAKGVAAYLLITFCGTWLWLLFATAALGLSPLDPLLQLPGFCMPGLAAVAVRRWISREGFADAGLRPRFRAAWKYYLLAWSGPAALAVCTLGLAALAGVWHPRLSGPAGVLPGGREGLWLLGLMLVALVLSPLYAGEEFGWTSYLRPRLFGGKTALSTVATGAVWAVWHFPLAFIGYVEFSDVLTGLLVWTLSFQLQEVLLAWLYDRSGSVWVPSLAHAGNNMVLFFVLGRFLDEEAGLGPVAPMLWCGAPMAVLCAAVLMARRTGRSGPAPALPGPAGG